MNFHNITTDDMNNGEGLRVVLWVAGCDHRCEGCHNPETWDVKGGIPFTSYNEIELLEELSKDYISGLTISGGDPLHKDNIHRIILLCRFLKRMFPSKTIWIYTGFTWERIMGSIFIKRELLPFIDVLIDGRFEESMKDVNYHWAGSTNQRVIDVKASLEKEEVVLLESN